ncbi:hypothetical protein CDAR_485601 [Caerostris darwini]|uniref:Uncharacterized protein n=1 Tax=Caerostris darwini TaxID=1538125 RepID=A0AAV4QZ19_9ARAC|nr:hypothetical protein CDAR_485601 [Caerostris darwini]
MQMNTPLPPWGQCYCVYQAGAAGLFTAWFCAMITVPECTDDRNCFSRFVCIIHRLKLIIRRTQNPAAGFAANNSQCEREVRSVLEMLSRFSQIVRGTGIPDVSEKNVILLSSRKKQTDCVCR